MRRRKARELVLRLLYQTEFRDVPIDELLNEYSYKDVYIGQTLRGVEENLQQIDDIISKRAEGWRLNRLVSVDRNILRLGIYELLFTQVPPEVVINEAVELAKKYGTEKSGSFINGILDRVYKEYKEKVNKVR